jgi:hypothetical protein
MCESAFGIVHDAFEMCEDVRKAHDDAFIIADSSFE